MTTDLQTLLHQFRISDLQSQLAASADLVKRGASAVQPLIAIVQDESASGAWWLAVDALRQIGDVRAVEPLIALLNNPVSHQAVLARKYTAYALALFADPRAVDALIAMLHEQSYREEDDDFVDDEPDYETIDAAAGALANIGDSRGIRAVLDLRFEDDFWGDGVTDYIHEWGGETAFQYLVNAVQSTDSETRARAASLLGQLGDPRAFPVLVDLLETEKDNRTRESAMSALGHLQTMRAAPIFLQALTDSDDEVQEQAALGIRSLLLEDFPMPEQPDKIARIKHVIQTMGETALISHLVHVTQTVRPSIAAYSALLLEAFAPHVSPALVEQQIEPVLDALPEAVKTWVSVEQRTLSTGRNKYPF